MKLRASYEDGKYSGVRLVGDINQDHIEALRISGMYFWLFDCRKLDDTGKVMRPYAVISASKENAEETIARTKSILAKIAKEPLEIEYH